MVLESYTKKIFRAECNPGFEALHCFAHLGQNVGEAIPYLNAVSPPAWSLPPKWPKGQKDLMTARRWTAQAENDCRAIRVGFVLIFN